MGDLLMNLPALRRLRLGFPKSSITLLADAASAPLLRAAPDVDEVIAVRREEISAAAERRRLFGALKKLRFDAAVVSNPSKFFHFFIWALGIPLRAGWDRKWGFLLNCRTPARAGDDTGHEIDRNLSLLDGFCPAAWDGRIELGFGAVPGREAVFADFKGARGAVFFHVGTSDPRKRWPLEKFGRVMKQVLASGRPAALVGGERVNPEELGLAGGETGFLNLSGRTSLPELAVLLSGAACLVSPDSGPFHVAWMQKTPVVGLFLSGAGGSDARRWGAYPGFGKAVHLEGAAADIREEDVIGGIHGCLREPAKNSRC